MNIFIVIITVVLGIGVLILSTPAEFKTSSSKLLLITPTGWKLLLITGILGSLNIYQAIVAKQPASLQNSLTPYFTGVHNGDLLLDVPIFNSGDKTATNVRYRSIFFVLNTDSSIVVINKQDRHRDIDVPPNCTAKRHYVIKNAKSIIGIQKNNTVYLYVQNIYNNGEDVEKETHAFYKWNSYFYNDFIKLDEYLLTEKLYKEIDKVK